MKFKEGIVIKKKEQYMLEWNQNICNVNKGDAYLIEALKNKNKKNEDLIKLIMEKETVNEAAAGFILARFVLNYQIFLEEDHNFFQIIE